MATERWIYLKEGKIIYHQENDGYRFLNRGAEAVDCVVTMKDLKKYSYLYEKALKIQDCIINNRSCNVCDLPCPKGLYD